MPRRPQLSSISWIAGGVLSLLSPGVLGQDARREATGQLGADLAKVQEAWKVPAEWTQPQARFLQRSERIPLPLPERTGSCLTVLALSAPNISFVLSFDRPLPLASTTRGTGEEVTRGPLAFPIQSRAGLAEVTRCGKRRRELDRLMVTMRSPRGTLQFLVAGSDRPPRSAASVLPRRQAGPEAPLVGIGRRPGLGPLSVRIPERRSHHRARGAEAVTELPLETDEEAPQLVRVGPGCHRIDILPEEVRGSTPDVDARLIDQETGEVVAEDETTTSDPWLAFCRAESATFRLQVRGAVGVPTEGILATWALPPGLPLTWGRRARAEMARALFDPDRGMASLSPHPETATLGVTGVTQTFIPTQPGVCYRIAVAAFQGDVTRLALGLGAGPLVRQAEAGQRTGAHLTFCATRQGEAEVEVQAAGTGVTWLLASWRLTPAPPGSSP